jgi:hypothetical protein
MTRNTGSRSSSWTARRAIVDLHALITSPQAGVLARLRTAPFFEQVLVGTTTGRARFGSRHLQFVSWARQTPCNSTRADQMPR